LKPIRATPACPRECGVLDGLIRAFTPAFDVLMRAFTPVFDVL
jgi:hypothetical protein